MDKPILITGAGDHDGATAVQRFSRFGHRVVRAHRTAEMVSELLHGECVECPSAGSEECETLVQLGTYCEVARAAGRSR